MWTSSDVSTSYRLAARSQEAVTTCRPPTNQSAAITTPWWLFRVAVATRTVGTSQGPSPSTSPSSLSDESWSSSHGACEWTKEDKHRFWVWLILHESKVTYLEMLLMFSPFVKWSFDRNTPRLCRTVQSHSHWHLVVAGGQEAAPCNARCEPSGPRRLRKREHTSTNTTSTSGSTENTLLEDNSSREEIV